MRKLTEDEIAVPKKLIEALLVALSVSDRNAITNVGNDIKRLAEDQDPEKFKTHRRA